MGATLAEHGESHVRSHEATLNQLILRSVVDHAIVTLDAAGIVTSWNEGAERILGWTEAEIVGRSADAFFTPEDVERNRPEVEMRIALQDGRAEDVRWHLRKDGRRFWGSGLMMPLLRGTDAEGDAVREADGAGGFVKIFRDRTFEHEARQRINLLEDRAAIAMRRSGTVGVYEYDIVEDLVVADATGAEMHGVPTAAAEAGTASATFFAGIHPDDVSRIRAALSCVVAEGGDFDQVYRTARADPHPRWIQSQGVVTRDDEGRAARLSGIVVDVTEQRQHAEMQDARLDFVEKVREIHDPVEIASLASRTIARTLRASRAGHGYIEADGDTIDIRADWTDESGTSLVGRYRYSDFGSFVSILHAGEALVITDARTDPRVDDPTALAEIEIRSLVNLPMMEAGRLKAVLFVNDVRPRDWSEAEIAFMKTIFDRTYAAIDRARSEVERDMMAAELAHRMRNMLTIAQVIVSQSLRGVADYEARRDAIAARLHALAQAQDVLTQVDRGGARIEDVIESALRPYNVGADRIRADGPAVALASQQVLGLSLALHELATNAAKHGALSSERGRIDITWSVEDGAFAFVWSERDGPVVDPPAVHGFGTTILDRVVGNYFGGAASVAYDPDGITFRIDGRV